MFFLYAAVLTLQCHIMSLARLSVPYVFLSPNSKTKKV